MQPASLKLSRKISSTLRTALALIFSVVGCFATDDEAANGDYSCVCQGLSASFRIDRAGLSKIRLNGKSYPDAELGTRGRFGYSSLYEFEVLEGSTTRSIQFLVLFDQDDQFKSVIGYYIETGVKGGPANDPRIQKNCKLTIRRTPLKPTREDKAR